MTLDRTLAITTRIILQMIRDHRSVVLIFVAPTVVMCLVGFTFSDQEDTLNRLAPGLIATFTLIFTFMLTGVSFLGERAHGTLDRLLMTPVGRGCSNLHYLIIFRVKSFHCSHYSTWTRYPAHAVIFYSRINVCGNYFPLRRI